MADPDSDARNHTYKMQRQLTEIIDYLRHDVEKVHEPQLKPMF